MNGETKERLLVWLLRLSGLATVVAFPTALLPAQWMEVVHQKLGMGAMPNGAVTQYMARSLSLLYGFHGLLTLLASTDVRRFRPIIGFIGWMLLSMGPAMTLIDLHSGLPIYWTLLEGPPLFAAGAAVLWLRGGVPKV